MDEVASWMPSNRLQLNTLKTEVLWCATNRWQHQIPHEPTRIGNDIVQSASSVCVTWASTSTLKPPWRLMSPKPCRAASMCFDRSGPSDDLSRARFSSRWSCHWCRLDLTTAMRLLLVCLVMSWTDSSQSWMLQHGSYSHVRSTIM